MAGLKAKQAFEFSTWLRSRYYGVTIADVQERFGVARRTAQRMLSVIEDLEIGYPTYDGEGRKRWKASRETDDAVIPVSADEISSLDIAAKALENLGDSEAVTKLQHLKEKLLAQQSSRKAVSLETDYQALIEAHGFAVRPGPKVSIGQSLFKDLHEAFKRCCRIEVSYNSEPTNLRKLEPYAVIYGPRVYLLAKGESGPDEHKYYRLDRINSLILLDEYFERDESFCLTEFASQSFGVFQNAEEFGDVKWLFSAAVADNVRNYQFHPDQKMKKLEDGRIEITFKASGWSEMYWELLRWGQHVEVVLPEKLQNFRQLQNHPDFSVVP